jgi:hypothetical protein
MSDDGHYLVLSATSPQADILAWAILVCKNAGLIVERPREWETPKEFCARIGISGQTLIRKLRDPRRPEIDLIRGRPKGRLKFLAATKRFEAFCLNQPSPINHQLLCPA